MDYGCFGAPLEIKFMDGGDKPPGYFEGYGAVFGNIDDGGDLIEPGAFAKSLLERQRASRGLPPMYKMHGAMLGNPQEPIGVWDHMEEDSNGLLVRGRLIGLDTEQGKWNYAQLRDGAFKGMSIGYRVPAGGSRSGGGKAGEPRRYLKTLNLREVSLVDDPMNNLARVSFMKSLMATDLEAFDPRALEAEFKSIMSNAAAVRAVAIVKRHLRDAGEEQPGMTSRDDEAAALVASLKRAAETLSIKRN
ncbi:HK97 family phage prohead protease [Azospirillum argentinense]|uniref:HK97 family phage prohead protease n=1 Tax=Azospirillum argentinense TaxID=2970906 RepID=A0ABW8V5C3_9PROT